MTSLAIHVCQNHGDVNTRCLCEMQDSKQRLKAMQKSTLPITASAFNRDGSIFAYSVRCCPAEPDLSHTTAEALTRLLYCS